MEEKYIKLNKIERHTDPEINGPRVKLITGERKQSISRHAQDGLLSKQTKNKSIL